MESVLSQYHADLDQDDVMLLANAIPTLDDLHETHFLCGALVAVLLSRHGVTCGIPDALTKKIDALMQHNVEWQTPELVMVSQRIYSCHVAFWR